MTDTEISVFQFVVKFKRQHDGNSPTVREIAAGCGLRSTNTVNYNLRKLEGHKMISVGLGAASRMIFVVGGYQNAAV